MLVHQIRIKHLRNARPARMTCPLNFKEIPIRNDIGPVMAAGIVNEQEHLGMPGKSVKGLKHLAGREEMPKTMTRLGISPGQSSMVSAASRKRL